MELGLHFELKYSLGLLQSLTATITQQMDQSVYACQDLLAHYLTVKFIAPFFMCNIQTLTRLIASLIRKKHLLNKS